MTWSGIPAGRIIVHVTIARVDPVDDGIPSARLAERSRWNRVFLISVDYPGQWKWSFFDEEILSDVSRRGTVGFNRDGFGTEP
jgi:hypothetical protein